MTERKAEASLYRCRSLLGFEGFDDNVVGVAAGGEEGEEGGAVFALGAEDGDVGGGGVGDEEEVLVGREGEGVGAGAGAYARGHAAVVDGVEGGGVCAEVGDPKAGVVLADDGAGGLGADDVGAQDFVGPGGDLGDGVGVEVGGEEFAAVGLEGEVGGGLADVEEGEEVVVLEVGVLLPAPGVGRGGEPDGHDLVASGAGDEGL